MPNQLWFDKGGPAERFYRDLDPEARASLDQVLDHIRDNSAPDSARITSVFMSPVVIYYYEDDDWKVSFNPSYYRSDESMHVQVWAIAAK